MGLEKIGGRISQVLRYSIRSAIEVIGCIYLAKRRSIIMDEDVSTIYAFTNIFVKRLRP